MYITILDLCILGILLMFIILFTFSTNIKHRQKKIKIVHNIAKIYCIFVYTLCLFILIIYSIIPKRFISEKMAKKILSTNDIFKKAIHFFVQKFGRSLFSYIYFHICFFIVIFLNISNKYKAIIHSCIFCIMICINFVMNANLKKIKIQHIKEKQLTPKQLQNQWINWLKNKHQPT